MYFYTGHIILPCITYHQWYESVLMFAYLLDFSGNDQRSHGQCHGRSSWFWKEHHVSTDIGDAWFPIARLDPGLDSSRGNYLFWTCQLWGIAEIPWGQWSAEYWFPPKLWPFQRLDHKTEAWGHFKAVKLKSISNIHIYIYLYIYMYIYILYQ